MSSALAIAATTETLRNLLNQGIPEVDPDISAGFAVATLTPDTVSKDKTDEWIGLNLFLFQTVVNAAWRNMDTPFSVRPGETAPPPLALNLHYLVTAYGKEDALLGNVSQRILGAAMSVLHDHPVLAREEIANALGGNDPADLSRQFERIRIAPLPMSVDELSKLWTMFQTQYRISAVYEASVVLIDSRRGARSPLPVLRRGEEDRGPVAIAGGAALLTGVRPPNRQPSVRLGEDVIFSTENLLGDGNALRLTHQHTGVPVIFDNIVVGMNGDVTIHTPSIDEALQAMHVWTPGYYAAAIVQKRPDVPDFSSNEIPLALAPRITVSPLAIAAGAFQLTITCTPRAADGQRILLLFGSRQIKSVSDTYPADTAQPSQHVFDISKDVADTYVVRLRVDGVDSIPVTLVDGLPAFDPDQQVTVQ